MMGKNIPNGNRYYDTAVLFLQSGTAEVVSGLCRERCLIMSKNKNQLNDKKNGGLNDKNPNTGAQDKNSNSFDNKNSNHSND
ncbi:MAG: hypothetical protein NC485_02705 [Ruminococcus flavefaciens]|nr:hypothetical protein [Ruminococcus flavefaciens]MCM1059009.1 hypothetical protein [Eubacterium sp.]